MEQTVNSDELIFEASDIMPEQTEEEAPTEAVEETTEQTASETEDAIEAPADSTTTESQTGDDYSDFLSKKGIKSDDPDALSKVVKMYRDAEKGFYAKSQEKAQLERKLAQTRTEIAETTPDQQALTEVRSLKIELDTNRWKAEKNLTPEAEAKMLDFISQPLIGRDGKPALDMEGNIIPKGYLVNNGILSLDDVYKLAGCEVPPSIDSIKEALKDEVRSEMVARQSANRPKATATDSTQFSKPAESDPFLDALLGK